MRMKLKIAWYFMATLLGGCTESTSKDISERAAYEATGPKLVATATDGTKLWEARVYHDYTVGDKKKFYYNTVYFSSKGTQRGVPSGKTTRQEIVPSAE